MKKTDTRGSGVILAVCVLMVAGILAATGWFVSRSNKADKQITQSSTEENSNDNSQSSSNGKEEQFNISDVSFTLLLPDIWKQLLCGGQITSIVPADFTEANCAIALPNPKVVIVAGQELPTDQSLGNCETAKSKANLTLPGFVSFDCSEEQVNGKQAIKTVTEHSGEHPEGPYTEVQYSIHSGTRPVILTYTHKKTGSQEYVTTFDDMVQSIRFN